MRFVRAHAAEFDIAPDRIGMMGFSAGGHLTAMAATMPEAGRADAADPLDRVSGRPDFQVLGYPWLNAMTKDQKAASYCSVLKIDPAQCATFEQYAPERLVAKDTPPAFIYMTTDDELVPVDGTVTFYRALNAAGVQAEMHIFGTGRPGAGSDWVTRRSTRGRDCWRPGCAPAASCRRHRPRRRADRERQPA